MSDAVPAVRVSSGVHSFFLEEGCLLFSEPRQEIHALNTSAAVIWCLLQDGWDEARIATKLEDSFGVSASDAAGFVRTAFADWNRHGFLDGSALIAPAEPMEATEQAVEQYGAKLLQGTPPFAEERSYTLLSSNLRIRFTAAEQAAVVHPVLAHFENADACSDAVVDVVQSGDGIAVYLDGEECGSCCGVEELAPLIKGLVWSTAVNRHDFFLGIHAGVVGGQSGAMLLPGSPGSGKSSLTAALVQAGFQYYSDEMALLRDDDFYVLPVPFSLCVKDTGIPVLTSRFPVLEQLPLHQRADGKRVAYLPPPYGCLPPFGEAKPVRALVFPRYAAHVATCSRVMPKADALQRLLEQCLVVRKRLDPRGVQALIRWIEPIECIELVFGTLDEGAAAAASLLDLPTAHHGVGSSAEGLSNRL
ncbi:PqqD family peptide modification chaperone [Roseomonas xinghualingensis]|uniref:PqqD family peptide modification chaperone n=1 Tax=Roseomonas xinghualingensis TaxID=2986475 RepID=UPI0021F0C53D|nr:PqqD family peptide modification chaperone [Roseomonas sp. SXEYE001]MCV4210047.1 hypothetical protein [Roseomonas sp. SXEYE001]